MVLILVYWLVLVSVLAMITVMVSTMVINTVTVGECVRIDDGYSDGDSVVVLIM